MPPVTPATSTDVFVQATPMIGQDLIVFTAWEPWANHATQKWQDSRWWGRIGTAGPGIDRLPPLGTAERQRFMYQWYDAQKTRAIEIILEHEPRLAEYGTPDYAAGQITARRTDLD